MPEAVEYVKTINKPFSGRIIIKGLFAKNTEDELVYKSADDEQELIKFMNDIADKKTLAIDDAIYMNTTNPEIIRMEFHGTDTEFAEGAENRDEAADMMLAYVIAYFDIRAMVVKQISVEAIGL